MVGIKGTGAAAKTPKLIQRKKKAARNDNATIINATTIEFEPERKERSEK